MKLKKKKIMRIGLLIMGLFLLCLVLYWLMVPRIVLSPQRNVEINSVVDYRSFISDVKHGNIDEVRVDSSQVNIHKVGNYQVIFHYEKIKKTMTLKVVDTTPPVVSTKEAKVALNQGIKADDLIESISDASQTKTYFLEDYQFDKLGQKEVTIVVEDKFHNKTEKQVMVDIVSDNEPPEIIASQLNVLIDHDIDIKSQISVYDDFDHDPEISIDTSQLNTSKAGTYPVVISVKDKSGNKSQKTIQVLVVTEEKHKVVYLTFDDGPSKHTPEVLDILNRYGCQATFFITGMNPQYRNYIKIASDQGHTIGLHTYSHNYSQIYASVDAYFEDLNKIGELAKEYLGYVPHYIRFPGGSSNAVSKKYCKGIMTQLTKMAEEKGYTYFDWNCENGDGYAKMSKNEMMRRATSATGNQVMILMHDANGKQNTIDILPQVIEYYQKRGYVFKAIDDSTDGFHQKVIN